MPHLLSIGDTMQDYFIGLTEASVMPSSPRGQLHLCVSYGNKIPARSLDILVGGNSANVAVSASRLGIKATLCSVLGDDEIADGIRASLKKEKIDTRLLLRDRGSRSNMSFILSHQGERTIIISHVPRQYRFPKISFKPDWVYFSSMGEAAENQKSFERFHRDVVGFVKKHRTYLAFNPGTFQLRMDRKILESVLAVTDILFLNIEEAMQILSLADRQPLGHMLTALRMLGPKIVVLTDGPAGAWAFDGTQAWEMPIFDSPVIERTGAGDSFAAGFTSAVMQEQEIPEALRWGAFNSASVVGKVGPQAGLLKKTEMRQRLQKNPKFLATEFPM